MPLSTGDTNEKKYIYCDGWFTICNPLMLSSCPPDVAASAYGRDFLSSGEDGQALIDTLCSVISEAPTGTDW